MTERKIPDIGLNAERIREMNAAFTAAMRAASEAFAEMGRQIRISQAMAHGRAAGTTSGMRKLVEVLEALNDADLAEVQLAAHRLNVAARHEQAEREKVS